MQILTPGSRVGPYEIVAPLRSGGMAALYLGRREGPAGFSKPVAIKVIHAHLASDTEFVSMFLDEARLAGRISDPNVVRVEALGEADGMFYLAMEYVLGTSLSNLATKISEAGRGLAPAAACAIAIGVANGLHAAHELKDDDGVALEVVHRDVSPQNVLVSRTGHVKVIDFGVALSRSHLRETDAGSLKGKLAYMSPEQAWGRPIDRRADVFALGIVLWEMLTLRRLFGGGSDIDRLERVRNPGATPAPSSFAPEVDAALDEVVLKALHPDPNERFQTARELRSALADACPDARRIHPEDLAALVETFVGEEIAEEQAVLKSHSSGWVVAAPEPEDAHTVVERLTRESIPEDRWPRGSASSSAPVGASAPYSAPIPPTNAGPARVAAPLPVDTSRSRLAVVAAVGIIGSVVGVLFGLSLLDRESPGGGLAVSSPDDPTDAATETITLSGCDGAERVVGRRGEPLELSFDTRTGGTAFALRGARNEEAPRAPQRVIEYFVDGDGTGALSLSTVNTGTDPRFDTLLAVFRGPCSESMYDAFPDVTMDDRGREFRASGSVAVNGGETLTVVLTGFGGDDSSRVGRGIAELHARLTTSEAPSLTEASTLVAGREVHVHVRGGDVDGDVEGVEVRLLDAAGRPIVLTQEPEAMIAMERAVRPEATGSLSAGFVRSVHGARTFRERATLLVPPEEESSLAAATHVEVNLVDATSRRSARRRADVVHGRVVGLDERCGAASVCADELTCARGRCAADVDRAAVCRGGRSIELTRGANGDLVGSAQGTIAAGAGRFTAQCVRRSTGGLEDVYRLEVPGGRWDIELTTDSEGTAGGSRRNPDTVLYVRRDCLDSRAASAPETWCNDDILWGGGVDANQRSRVVLPNIGSSTLYIFVELWGRALPHAEGERYELAVTLTEHGAD